MNDRVANIADAAAAAPTAAAAAAGTQRRRGKNKNKQKKTLDELEARCRELEARCRLTCTVLLYFCSSITVTLHNSTTEFLYHCSVRLYSCTTMLLYLVDSSTSLGAHPHIFLIVHVNVDGTESLPTPSTHPHWQ